MSPAPPSPSLPDLVAEFTHEPRTLTLVNPSGPPAMTGLLESVFGSESVTVRTAETESGAPEDVVVLSAAGETLAASRLADVRDEVLIVNADVYRTGTRSLSEVELADVVEGLADVRMTAEGYPSQEDTKMLLVEVSRGIERRAFDGGGGRLHAGFQWLSRIDDESGTREVYEDLAATGVDVHAYGVPDYDPPDSLDLAVHGHDTRELRESWFVVYEPPAGDPTAPGPAALLAHRVGPNEWDGAWTYDPDRVERITAALTDRYGRTGPGQAAAGD